LSIDSALFRRVLGHYPTGVCAVTAINADGAPTGLIVGSFASASLDPPLVVFFPDRRSTSWPQIEAVGRFAINVLASNQQPLCRQLAAPGTGKFDGVDYSLSALGSPVLPGILAWIDCSLHAVQDAGDHYAVYGRVEALDAGHDGDAMLFFKGQYGGFVHIPFSEDA
jgi:3-hydroxy-9,10-secoandrosta-1,3,5(10)-triene-9,17-dione monooxygenase reductase component